MEKIEEKLPFVSVVIPTYNRKKILEKCLSSLLAQTYPNDRYEIIVIDDGSKDGTDEMVLRLIKGHKSVGEPIIIYEWQEHTSAAAARNRGILEASGDLVILLDSDIVTLPDFIESHVFAQFDSGSKFSPDNKRIVHGRVIYTEDLDNPTSTKKKLSDMSMAFFASGNVSIARRWLIKAGLFDEDFTEYGWEDLELGQRLKKLGLRVVRSDKPAGYHLKHEFSIDKLPNIRKREIERGRMAVIYYMKHPTISVRMSTTMIWPFYLLVGIFTLFGWPDRPGTVKLIDYLDKQGFKTLLGVLLQLMIYYWYIQGIKEGTDKYYKA
ncbi:MAG: glycosyltransferase [Firmicutes bacterium]|nr:glycosyltransferase [Bacillota bacterium]